MFNSNKRRRPVYTQTNSRNHNGFILKTVMVFIILAVIMVVGLTFRSLISNAKSSNIPKINESTSSKLSNANSNFKSNNQTATNPIVVNACSNNTISKIVIVSISARHLWACSLQTLDFNSPVVTGMDFLAADLTPTGNYTILDKKTDINLIGSDSTGSWDDHVSYWMGFLTNKYGQYGFHDATWRPASAFGNISPNSSNASHGCVECPLATAKWLYGWVQVGTQVQIIS